jgi:hypothetical protein
MVESRNSVRDDDLDYAKVVSALESGRVSDMPRVTGVVLSITAIVTGLQWMVPGLPHLMQRSPAVLTVSGGG